MTAKATWGCGACKTRNPVTKKRCKKCGRRPNNVVPLSGSRHGRLTSAQPAVQTIPKPPRVTAAFSDGATVSLLRDGSITCTCADFKTASTCQHRKGLEELFGTPIVHLVGKL